MKGVSCSWNWLLNALLIINQWISWRPGNGWSIRVGEDPIVAIGNYKLSYDVLNHLHSRGIFFLAQIHNQEASRFWYGPLDYC
jgi:hypothetical protein